MDISEKALPLGEDLSWLWGPESETTLGLVGSAWGLECSELSRGEEDVTMWSGCQPHCVPAG